MRPGADGLLLFQHPRLEYLAGPSLTEKNKGNLTACADGKRPLFLFVQGDCQDIGSE
jgi:hypothetical protein